MKYKKYLTLSITSLMLLFLVSGCSNNDDSKKSSEKNKTEKVDKKKNKTKKETTKKQEKKDTTTEEEKPAITTNEPVQTEQVQEQQAPAKTNAQLEAENGNMPIDSDPIKNADQAVAYLITQKGDHNWFVTHGSAGMSSPIYWTIDGDNGERWIVYADGRIEI
ncbi:hypothetical protein RD055328_01380 [Companilactobacillus sp. RD055328]|uniref:hypothetical protein n=1 Tax=Companilactobacillus sp. RD055328 TaxID=2916634 RepID=UPI001FC82E74|nr:hypothetical protein [Companilactobacillus sp. RD055328]GKQ42215.1 hypothetical protein RD055328_01380 [Companilactobacillus sp. RD055328]